MIKAERMLCRKMKEEEAEVLSTAFLEEAVHLMTSLGLAGSREEVQYRGFTQADLIQLTLPRRERNS